MLTRFFAQMCFTMFLILCCEIGTVSAQNVPELAKEALAATVYLEMEANDGTSLGSGSGFFVTPNTVVTNYHVIAGAAHGTIKQVGKHKKHKIEGVIAIDKDNNLALLKVSNDGIIPLPLPLITDSRTIKLGEEAYVTWCSKTLNGKFSKGHIRALSDKKLVIRTPIMANNGGGGVVLNALGEVIGVSCPIAPGSRGGVVLNASGEVVGIGSFQHNIVNIKHKYLNFVIPMNVLKVLLLQSEPAIPLSRLKNNTITANTYFHWGYTDYQQADFEKAIKDWTMIIDLAPNNVFVAHNLIGIAKAKLGQYAEAIREYDTAIKLKADYTDAFLNRAFAKLETEDALGAIDDFDTVLRSDSHKYNAEVYYHRGAVKLLIGHTTDGEKDLHIALKYANQQERKNFKEAIEMLKQINKATLIVSETLAATVQLEMEANDGTSLGSGSGFFMTPNTVVTNYHVIAGAAHGTIKQDSTIVLGRHKIHKIEGVIAIDKDNNLALLKVSNDGIKPLPLITDSQTIKLGEEVHVAWCSKALNGKFSNGEILALGSKKLVIRTPITEDSSGGAVLNVLGEVIGVSLPVAPGSGGGVVLNAHGDVVGTADFQNDIVNIEHLHFVIPTNVLNALLLQNNPAIPLSQLKNNTITANTYFHWGYTDYQRGDYEKAIKDWTMIIDLNSDNVFVAHNLIGIAKAKLGQYAEAIREYDTAIKLKAKYIDAFVNRGIAKSETGDLLGAIDDFDTVLRSPHRYVYEAKVYYHQGVSKIILGHTVDGEQDLHTALKHVEHAEKQERQHLKKTIEQALKQLKKADR